MEYKNDNFKIYGFQTKKFKTIVINIMFMGNVSSKDFIYSELLMEVLTYSNSKYKTNRELCMHYQDLYDIFLSGFSQRVSNKLISTIDVSMLDPKFTSKKVVKDSIKTISDIIFKPNIVDNHFESTSFHIVKEQLINFIDNVLQTPQNYVTDKLYSSFKEATVSNTLFSTKEELESIDEYKLYDYYKEFLNNREIEVYVVGDYDDSLIELIKGLPLVSKTVSYEPIKIINKKQDDLIVCKDYTQAKIGMLYTYLKPTYYEQYYVSNVLSNLLGGLQDSLLMENIREMHSLVYYVDAYNMKYDQVTIISSGFNSSKSDLFIKKVKETIKDLTTGNFSDNKLKCSKLDIVVSLEDNEKSPYVIIRNMLSINHFVKENIKERIKLYKNVTKEDVINLAKKMKLMKIVLLRDKDERV